MGNAPDPDLQPVAAAQAFLDAQASAAAPVQPGPAKARPSITPAQPDRWTKTVPLDYPLIVDGTALDHLVLTRLSARALTDLLMEDDDAESLNRRVRAAVAGVHPDVLDALEGDDATRVMEAIRPFLPRAIVGAELLELAAAAGDVLANGAG